MCSEKHVDSDFNCMKLSTVSCKNKTSDNIQYILFYLYYLILLERKRKPGPENLNKCVELFWNACLPVIRLEMEMAYGYLIWCHYLGGCSVSEHVMPLEHAPIWGLTCWLWVPKWSWRGADAKFRESRCVLQFL